MIVNIDLTVLDDNESDDSGYINGLGMTLTYILLSYMPRRDIFKTKESG